MLQKSPDTASDRPSRAAVEEGGRLYGRDREKAQLLEAFQASSLGEGRVVLLSGPSGSGKTVLAQSLKKSVLERNGFFLEGKFNQYQQGIPLYAIRQALRQLLHQLTADKTVDQVRLGQRITESVGDLGLLITDLVPELEALIGQQPSLPAISPFEAPHRFTAVLRRFLSVFCKPEHPLVLFIDDWQWADPLSLRVLEQLQLNSELRFVLVIVCYRDSEVDKTHPLRASIEQLDLYGVPLQPVKVRDLKSAQVQLLLRDALAPALRQPDHLAHHVHKVTGGNPFYVHTLLDTLRDKGDVWFDGNRERWDWKAESALLHRHRGGVTHLFALRLKRLPASCQQLLSIAACMGHRFRLDYLALVAQMSLEECRLRLAPAQQQAVIFEIENVEHVYRFRHDRAQQAAHGLVSAEQLAGVRLTIGRLLDERLEHQQKAQQIIEIADHFNAGQALLNEQTDIQRLIDLNISAGMQSRAATAYRSALEFFRMARRMLTRQIEPDEFWRRRHATALQFYLEWSECEFLEGNTEQAEWGLLLAAQHTRSRYELADVLCQSILQNTLLARYSKAIKAGRDALLALDVELPETDFEQVRDSEIAQIYRAIDGKTIEDLQSSPPMEDRLTLAITRVLITMGPPCYRAHQPLWSVLVPKVVNLTLQFGPIPQVGYSHTALAGLLAWVNSDFETGKLFKTLSIRWMTGLFSNPSDQSVFYLMVGSSARHWHRHLGVSSEDYVKAWETGLASGNLQYAAYAFGHNMYCRFFQGVALDEQLEDVEKSLQFSRTRRNQWATDLLEGGLRIIRQLAGHEVGVQALSHSHQARSEGNPNIQVQCIHEVLESMLQLFLGDPQRALDHSDRAAPLIYTVGTQGLLPWPEFVFSRLLILCAVAINGPAEESADRLGEAPSLLSKLEVWAEHVTDNYGFKLALAEAMLARARGRSGQAMARFAVAIEAARESGFVHWEAFACEQAADLALDDKRYPEAQVYWQFAYQGYRRWGAQAKTRQMERMFLQDSEFSSSPERAVASIFGRYLESLRSLASPGAAEERHAPAELVDELTRATERLSREVAQRKQAEHDLRLAASVFEHAREGIVITDLDARILDCNKAFSRITGYSRDEALGRSPRFLQSGRHDSAFFAEFWRSLKENGYWQGEIWNRRKSGQPFAELLTVSAVQDHHGAVEHYVGLFSDITGIKEQQRKLEIDAYHDALTGLPNRTLFADRLRQAMNQAKRSGSRIAVIFMDLDGFKQINDQHGHDAGDQLLVHVTRQMSKVLRESDTLSRLGGDEFVCVAREIDDDDKSRVLFTRLLTVLSEGVIINDQLLQVSASLGATFYPQVDAIDAEQLLRQADQAMYQAKLSGKNRFHVFDERHDRSLRAHHETLEQIKAGMEQGEFILHFQPKVDMRSGSVIGLEALLRWQHSRHGLLTPDRFLPVIEDHPLIIDMGTSVLQQAFEQLHQWRQQGLELALSINISARELQQVDFLERLKKVAEKYDNRLNSMIEFEILETSALRDIEHVTDVIQQCAAMGFSFSLDDFGTGYSSLTYLKRLPVSTIKIDKSFVRDMLEDADDLSILQGVIGLAASFNRHVIAEGVETPEHGELLLWLGCTLGQGFGIARPMEAELVPGWVESWETFADWKESGQISNEMLQLLMVVIRHRSWINEVDDYLNDELPAPPDLDDSQYRFENLLECLGQAERGNELELLRSLHEQVHRLVQRLVARKQSGQDEAVSSDISELRVLGDTFLSILRQFINQ